MEISEPWNFEYEWISRYRGAYIDDWAFKISDLQYLPFSSSENDGKIITAK